FRFLACRFLCGLLRFLLHAHGFGLRCFGLFASLLRFHATLRFGGGIGVGLGFALLGGFLVSRNFRLCIFLGLLLHRHDAGFFGGSHHFTRRGFDGLFVALVCVNSFSVAQLLFGFRKSRRCIFVGQGDVRDAHRVAGLEKLQRRLAIYAENGVLDFSVGRRVDAAAQQFVAGVYVFHFTKRRWTKNVFQHHGVARLRDREIRLRRHDHAERLHVGDRLHFATAVF